MVTVEPPLQFRQSADTRRSSFGLRGCGGFSIKSGGVFYQYSILMYPAVFRCILLKYCILAYSDVFQNVFSYLLVCDRDTLCFMYSDVFCMYSTCILRRGRDTSRYTYPLTHLRGTSPSAGLGTSPSLRSLGSAPSGLSLEWGGWFVDLRPRGA